MSKIKNFLNSAKHLHVKDVTEKFEIHLEIEKKLIPRLKAVGLILLIFSLFSFFYAYFSTTYENPFPSENLSQESLLDDDFDIPPELTATERLNFYVISGIFTAVGVTCLLICNKKKREHKKRGS